MNTPFIFNPSKFHLLYSIHPHSTFYIHVLLSSAPLQFSFLWPYLSGPETQTQTQLTTEWAGSTWNLLSYNNCCREDFDHDYECKCDFFRILRGWWWSYSSFHTHIIFIIMIIILHRSELQSLANQTAYNVSQLLDNLLQVTIFQPSSDVLLDFTP